MFLQFQSIILELCLLSFGMQLILLGLSSILWWRKNRSQLKSHPRGLFSKDPLSDNNSSMLYLGVITAPYEITRCSSVNFVMVGWSLLVVAASLGLLFLAGRVWLCQASSFLNTILNLVHFLAIFYECALDHQLQSTLFLTTNVDTCFSTCPFPLNRQRYPLQKGKNIYLGIRLLIRKTTKEIKLLPK